MIYSVCGKIGAGKTLSLVRRMTEHMAKGGVCATNIKLYLDGRTDRRSGEELPGLRSYMEQRHGWTFREGQYIYIPGEKMPRFFEYVPRAQGKLPVMLVVDEASEWFDSANYREALDDTISSIRQSRKFGVDMWFSTQAFSFLNKRIRTMVQVNWNIMDLRDIWKILLPFVGPIRLCPVQLIKEQPMLVAGGKDFSLAAPPAHTPDRRLFGLYDTEELFREFGFRDDLITEFSPMETEEQKGKKMKLPWKVACVVAVIGAAVSVYFQFRPRPPADHSAEIKLQVAEQLAELGPWVHGAAGSNAVERRRGESETVRETSDGLKMADYSVAQRGNRRVVLLGGKVYRIGEGTPWGILSAVTPAGLRFMGPGGDVRFVLRGE